MSVPNPPTFDEAGIRPFCSDHTLEFFWIPPASGETPSGYTLSCPEASITISYPSTTTYAKVTDLPNGIDYTFYITADNGAGSSDPAYFRTVQAGNIPTGSPVHAITTQPSDTTAVISWNAPEVTPDATIKWYVITAQNLDDLGEPLHRASVPGTSTSYFFNDLTSGAKYRMSIYAVNDPGYSYPILSLSYVPVAITSGLVLSIDANAYNTVTRNLQESVGGYNYTSGELGPTQSTNSLLINTLDMNFLSSLTSVPASEQYTVSAWINTLSSMTQQSVFQDAPDISGNSLFDVGAVLDTDTGLLKGNFGLLRTGFPSTTVSLSSSTEFDLNTWTNITGVVDNINHRLALYIDGSNKVSNELGSGGCALGFQFVTGVGGGGGGRFGGGAGGAQFPIGEFSAKGSGGGGGSYWDSNVVTMDETANGNSLYPPKSDFSPPADPFWVPHIANGHVRLDSNFEPVGNGRIVFTSDGYDNISTLSTVFDYTGSDQLYTVPSGISTIFFRVWGAGGSSAYGGITALGGGAGAYQRGNFPVNEGDQLTLIVGQGGDINNPFVPNYGGGGIPGIYSFYYGGPGGGRSAIQLNNVEIVTAGGGGGAGLNSQYGGAAYGDGTQSESGSGASGYDGSGGSSNAPGRGGGVASPEDEFYPADGFTPQVGSIANIIGPLFNGAVGHISFYNTALTDLQVSQNYSSTKAFYNY